MFVIFYEMPGIVEKKAGFLLKTGLSTHSFDCFFIPFEIAPAMFSG